MGSVPAWVEIVHDRGRGVHRAGSISMCVCVGAVVEGVCDGRTIKKQSPIRGETGGKQVANRATDDNADRVRSSCAWDTPSARAL